MIVDSSAIVAILLREPGHEPLIELVGREPAAGVGTPTLVETGIVMAARLGVRGRTLLSRFLQESAIRPVAFEDDHWPVAVDAFLRFGRGRHPASLNFGDCLTYAIAKLAAEPLLCIGDDFAKTDVELALRDGAR